MNEYVVMYKGEMMSLEDYLMTKEEETMWTFTEPKNEKITQDDLTDYAVMYKGKKMSLDEYLVSKECESCLSVAA